MERCLLNLLQLRTSAENWVGKNQIGTLPVRCSLCVKSVFSLSFSDAWCLYK